MIFRLSAIACLMITLCACNPATALREPEVEAQLRATFDTMRSPTGDALALFTAEAAPSVTPETVASIRAQIPAAAPKSRTPLGTTVRSETDGSFIDAVDQYAYGDRVLTVETQLHRASSKEPWKVNGFHVQAATTAEIEASRSGIAGWQNLFLVMVAGSVGMMIAALVKVIRTKGLRRKWLWGIVSFVGLFSFQMNLTSGQMLMNFLSVQLIGAGVVKGAGPLAPWIASFTLPVGALLILTGIWANPKRAKRKPVAAEESF